MALVREPTRTARGAVARPGLALVRLLTLVVATIPGHHEHTAPAILRSHALRVLRRRSPTDHQVGRR